MAFTPACREELQKGPKHRSPAAKADWHRPALTGERSELPGPRAGKDERRVRGAASVPPQQTRDTHGEVSGRAWGQCSQQDAGLKGMEGKTRKTQGHRGVEEGSGGAPRALLSATPPPTERSSAGCLRHSPHTARQCRSSPRTLGASWVLGMGTAAVSYLHALLTGRVPLGRWLHPCDPRQPHPLNGCSADKLLREVTGTCMGTV